MNIKTAEKTEAPATQTRGEIVTFQKPRLPYHKAFEDRFGVDPGQWKVLVEAVFPLAKTVDSVALALSYCKSRNLDVFKRPVHIVPMWNSAANNGKGAMTETVWPSISELRTTAFRTGNYAGKSATQFGPLKEQEFKGTVGRDNNERTVTANVEYPEWAQITLYRMLNNVRCEFVGPKVYWLESYGRIGKSDVPNDMWCKRPSGQLEKVAEAAALRVAFPEEIGNEYAAEEMEGQSLIDPSERAKDVTPREPPAPNMEPPKPAEPMPPAAEPTATVGAVIDQPPPAQPVATEIKSATPMTPEQLLVWIDGQLKVAKDIDALQTIWNDTVEPRLIDLFPPDKDEALGIFKKYERTFE